MPLPLEIVDRLIERLAVTYAADWIRKWEGFEPAAVKTTFAAELEAFSNPEAWYRIEWALANLPTKCPNAPEFKRLCFQAPVVEAAQLPPPAADPAKVAAELKKQDEIRRKPAGPNRDWHLAILARHKAGAKISPGVLKMAQEASLRASVSHGA